MSAPQQELRIYLHPSAFVQRFTVEPGTVLLHKIFQKCLDGKVKIIISLWTLNQAVEMLDKKYRDESGRSDLDVNRIAFGMFAVSDYMRAVDRIMGIDMTEELVGGATGYITQYHIPADEALHIWSAEFGKSDIFVIFDGDYIETIKSTSLFDIYDISNEKERAILENLIDNL